MMKNYELVNGVYNVGAQDKERKVFDELVQLPYGTTYNSYLVVGKHKTALIDSVDITKKDELFTKLQHCGINKIDYVISNHAEQDHSGSLPDILRKFPGAKIVTNELCKKMLKDLLNVDEQDFLVIKENDELDLGERRIKFILTPWVHWPETMVSYLKEDSILFSCDMFGSHLVFDDVYSSKNLESEYFLKKYFAEIMMVFRKNVLENIEKLKNLEIRLIAPSHGPVHNDPKRVICNYIKWSGDKVDKKAVIAFITMHNSTKSAAEILEIELVKNSIRVKSFDLGSADIGEIAVELIDASTFIIATPTFLGNAHPKALYAAHVFNSLKPKTRFFCIINSYGWHGKACEQIEGIVKNNSLEVIQPVKFKGFLKKEEKLKLEALAREIRDKNKLVVT